MMIEVDQRQMADGIRGLATQLPGGHRLLAGSGRAIWSLSPNSMMYNANREMIEKGKQ